MDPNSCHAVINMEISDSYPFIRMCFDKTTFISPPGKTRLRHTVLKSVIPILTILPYMAVLFTHRYTYNGI